MNLRADAVRSRAFLRVEAAAHPVGGLLVTDRAPHLWKKQSDIPRHVEAKRTIVIDCDLLPRLVYFAAQHFPDVRRIGGINASTLSRINVQLNAENVSAQILFKPEIHCVPCVWRRRGKDEETFETLPKRIDVLCFKSAA